MKSSVRVLASWQTEAHLFEPLCDCNNFLVLKSSNIHGHWTGSEHINFSCLEIWGYTRTIDFSEGFLSKQDLSSYLSQFSRMLSQ